MSGFLKSVGKVFKKIIKSPIFKVVAIAAAVYFTGGLALGAMGSTFAASMPGIAGLAEGLGVTAGAFGAVEGAAGAAAGLAGGALTAAESGGLAAGMESGLTAAGVAGETSGGVLMGTAGLGETAAEASGAALNTAASGAPLSPSAGAGGFAPGTQGAAGIGESMGSSVPMGGANAAGAAGSGPMSWFNNLSSGAQKMVLEGGKEGLKMVAGGIQQKDQQDFYQKQLNDQREETKRKGQTIDMTKTYQTPGVIKSLMNGG